MFHPKQLKEEHRKPYRGSKNFDRSCRNHSGCAYCEGSRLYNHKKTTEAAEALMDYFNEYYASDYYMEDEGYTPRVFILFERDGDCGEIMCMHGVFDDLAEAHEYVIKESLENTFVRSFSVGFPEYLDFF